MIKKKSENSETKSPILMGYRRKSIRARIYHQLKAYLTRSNSIEQQSLLINR